MLNASTVALHRVANALADVQFASTRNDSADAPVRSPLLIATLNRPTGATGVHTQTAALADGLRSRGQDVEVICPFDASAAWLAVFAVRKALRPFDRTASTLWYRRWHLAALRQALRRQLRAGEPSALLAQCPVSALAALSLRQQMDLRFPIVLACHFNFSEAAEYRERGELKSEAAYEQMLELEKSVIGAVDHVIFVSQWSRRCVEQDRQMSPRAASVICNGIADESPVPVSREALGLDRRDLAMINVGTLEPRKNQLRLLELFARLLPACPQARLLLVGDGPMKGAVRRQISRLKLDRQVQLLGKRNDVPSLLAASDLYLHFATAENCPVALIEAARAGLPIAAPAGAGTTELLQATGGVALDAADIDRSAEALRSMLLYPSARRKAGQSARRAFERFYTAEAMVDAYMKVLRGGAR